jgi:hypothetical protein
VSEKQARFCEDKQKKIHSKETFVGNQKLVASEIRENVL